MSKEVELGCFCMNAESYWTTGLKLTEPRATQLQGNNLNHFLLIFLRRHDCGKIVNKCKRGNDIKHVILCYIFRTNLKCQKGHSSFLPKLLVLIFFPP